MENNKIPLLTRQEMIKAENAILRLRLKLEHGVETGEMSALPLDVENQWLKSVYAFEQQYKNSKKTKVYDYLGRPQFVKAELLTQELITQELKRLEVIMENNGIRLDCLGSYDDEKIYRFITEELFEHPMNDMRIPDMTLHFTYEEFHPNHELDLERDSADFIAAVYSREWDDEFDAIKIAPTVRFRGKIYTNPEVSSIIQAFQEAHAPLKVTHLSIGKMSIAEDLSKAKVSTSLRIAGKMKTGDPACYDGKGFLEFERPDKFWRIAEFDLPGLRPEGG